MPDALMLFAAGFGTRMGALTADRPKPLVEVAGKLFLAGTGEFQKTSFPQRVRRIHTLIH